MGSRGRKTYTDEQKAAALAALVTYRDDVSKAARAAGVDRSSLARWKKNAPETIAQIAQGKQDDLATMMEGIARRATGYVGAAFDAMDAATDDNGASLTGAIALSHLSDLNRIAGTAVDKWQLLTGGATARVEHDVVIDAGDDGRA